MICPGDYVSSHDFRVITFKGWLLVVGVIDQQHILVLLGDRLRWALSWMSMYAQRIGDYDLLQEWDEAMNYIDDPNRQSSAAERFEELKQKLAASFNF